MRYKAFISYRHESPDQEIAKRLHSLIENFAIPLNLKKSLGIRKMGRVFRDEDELPLSADLGEEIREALRNSEWLIAICSPRYLKSKWCIEEINYYISLGRRDKILAILIEDEPKVSFPIELQYEIIDGKRIEKEPLAADVRGDNLNESLKKLNDEKYRIMAPMLGVTYDDLKQRSKARRNKIYAAIMSGIIVLLLGFLSYATIKNNQINKERNEALIAESQWLSKSANEALENNDRMLAMLLYLEALPKNLDNLDRPIIKEAQDGLFNAIISSNASNSYSGVGEINFDFDSRIIDIKTLGNKLYLTTNNAINVLDLDSGRLLNPLESDEEIIYGTSIKSDEDYIVYHQNYYENHTSYYETIKERYEDSYQYDYDFIDDVFYYYENIYTLRAQEAFAIYGNDNYLQVYRQSWKSPDRRFEETINYVRAFKNDFLVTLEPDGTIGNKNNILLINEYNEIINTYTYETVDDVFAKNVVDVIGTPDNKLVIGQAEKYLYFWTKNSSEAFRTIEINRFDDTSFVKIITPSQTKYSFIAVLTEGGNIYFYDYIDDEVLFKVDNGLNLLQTMMFNYDGNRILCATDRNSALIFSTSDGSLIEKLEADFNVRGAFYARKDCYENAYNDNYIILADGEYGYHSKWRIDNIFIYSTSTYEETAKYKRILPIDSFSQAQFSSDNKSLWLANGTPGAFSSFLAVYDVENASLISIIEDRSSHIYQFDKYIISIPKADDLRLYEDMEKIYIKIYDENTLELIKTLYPNYEHVFKGEKDLYTTPEGIAYDPPYFSDDGKYMILQWDHNKNRNRSEAFVFVYDTSTWQELWHIGIYDAYDRDNNSIMPETDSFDGDLYVYAYPTKDNKILIQYLYANDDIRSYFYHHLAYELRDIQTGEILDTYVLENTYRFEYNQDDNVIMLYANDEEYEMHHPEIIFNTNSFENIADKYEYQEKEEISNEAYGGKIVAQNDDLLLIKGTNEAYILNIPSLKQAISSAKAILNGRELTDIQKEKYFLE